MRSSNIRWTFFSNPEYACTTYHFFDISTFPSQQYIKK
ncbi:hypothetical protein NMA510612_0158 [Neisseria meningitidis]|uniref:Uncharacterized protein n=3 Tax=Neisseria meningitidis TaxID=487 RepID=X5EFQ8_NEIME|nr:hypothetical protein NMA510612_0158 [Neisseria meningitidis]CBA06665.1 hypothetical protein predicted by Glimmer/Critica [Neisseria meningitidis alpha275]CBA08162.1 hypothetical protein predicted by Glimmer/Critica [Neisseria meningitidis alpha153]